MDGFHDAIVSRKLCLLVTCYGKLHSKQTWWLTWHRSLGDTEDQKKVCWRMWLNGRTCHYQKQWESRRGADDTSGEGWYVHTAVKAGHRINKKSRALNDTTCHSYKVSLAIWDHTVLPSTRHKWTHPALTPAAQTGISWFSYPGGIEGWVDLSDRLHTEMVYPPTDGHPSKY